MYQKLMVNNFMPTDRHGWRSEQHQTVKLDYITYEEMSAERACKAGRSELLSAGACLVYREVSRLPIADKLVVTYTIYRKVF